MAVVHLDVIPPNIPDITKLLIYEASSSAGPDTLIETVTPVGAYPTYLSRYTTTAATNALNWFSVDWEDSKGARVGRSTRMQGGTQTVISKLINRVMLRDASLSENIVAQEAEAVIFDYFDVADPYDPALTATPRQLAGLTYLVQARSYIAAVITSSATSDSYTAGLISQKAGDTTVATNRIQLIQGLIDQANALLGIATTFVMLIEDVDPTGIGMRSGIEWDHSRLQVTELP
jgi:hypothetical protein